MLKDYMDIEILTGYKETPLQPMKPTKVALDRYSFGDNLKGSYGSGIYMPNIEGGSKIRDLKGRGVQYRQEVWIKDCKSS